ncbi:MAG TPA: hypothetical protein VJH23_05050 [archaeon]|nr:hypothetical protein [archaeon]
MNPKIILALLVLLFPLAASAISSNDAVNFIVNTNHFLYDAETYTPPNVSVHYGESDYWVIPITAGKDIVTYFPVNSKTGTLSVSKADNRALFTLANNLRELQLIKESITPNSGIDWIFTQKYQTVFSEMSLQISDEIYQLNTVETALKGKGITADLGGMKAQLLSMSATSSSIAKKIADSSQSENDFATKPSEETFSEMNDSFKGVFDSINSLNSTFLSYNSQRNKLKQQISIADLEAQEKSQLSAILDIPPSLQSLGNYNINSQQISEKLNSSLQETSLRMDSLLDEFSNRMLKNDVYDLIYADNEKIKKDTPFNSLSEARSGILSEQQRSLWENQTKVNQLEQDYSRALKFYGEKNFESANTYAATAIDDAIAVYKRGQKPPVAGPAISQDFLFQAAGILVVLLALLYVFNNRGKIKGAITKEPEEVNLYG